MDVSQAVDQRISTRAFLDKPVTETELRALIDDARFAASGGNLQPWKVVAVARGCGEGDASPASSACASRSKSSENMDCGTSGIRAQTQEVE